MSLIKNFTIFIMLIYSAGAFAGASSKGMGEITFSGWTSASAKEKSEARSEARISAIASWASSQGSSFLKNYDTVRDRVEANTDTYILSESIINEKTDKDSKTYKIVLKATIDDVRIKNLVNDSSAIQQTSSDDRSYMTFVFVSRRQTSVQSYDTKVYKRVDNSNLEDGSEQEQANASGIAYSSESNKSSSSTSGGSTTLKADKITYDVASADEINVAMSEIFSTSGFEVVEAEYLEAESGGLVSVDAFMEDFKTGDDISSKTKRDSAKGTKMLDIPYLALGTLDIGIREIDSATGNIRVNVTVTGKMINVEKRFPKTVASVGPIIVAGLGPNQSVAESNALKKAANMAATELVNQLNSKGVM
jgi:hypothetical protein